MREIESLRALTSTVDECQYHPRTFNSQPPARRLFRHGREKPFVNSIREDFALAPRCEPQALAHCLGLDQDPPCSQSQELGHQDPGSAFERNPTSSVGFSVEVIAAERNQIPDAQTGDSERC